MRYKYLTDTTIKTTADCVALLNKEIGQSNWKRLKKFKIHENTVRVFKNSNNIVYTLLTDFYDSGHLLYDYDLSVHMPLFDAIKAESKKWYTHDYGDVSLNLDTMSMVMSGGDGGIVYSTKSKATIQKEIDEEGMGEDDVFLGEKQVPMNTVSGITCIKKLEYEAEWSPEMEDGYFIVSSINTLN